MLRHSFISSTSAPIKEAWTSVNGTKATYWKGIGLCLLIFVLIVSFTTTLSILYTWSAELTQQFGSFMGGAWMLLALIPLYIGLTYIGLQRALQQSIAFKQAFIVYPLFWEIIGPFILTQAIFYGILFTFGFLVGNLYNLLFYISPSIDTWTDNWAGLLNTINVIIALFAKIYFGLCFIFAPLLIIVKKFTVLHAMYYSFMIVNKNFLKCLMIVLIAAFVLIVSAIPLGIGLIWTLPWSFNLYGILYRTFINDDILPKTS